MGRKRKKYPREFKIEAVRQLESNECSAAELARRLGVTQSNLIQRDPTVPVRTFEHFRMNTIF